MREPVKPVGQATLDVAYRNYHLQVEFIIDTGEATLLGLDACEQLGLVKIADAVEMPSTSRFARNLTTIFIRYVVVPKQIGRSQF